MIAAFLLKYKSLRIFYVIYFLLIISCGWIQLMYSPVEIFLCINQLVSTPLNYFFEIFTWIGSGWVYAAVCAIIFFIERKYFWLSLVCYASTGLIAQAIKNVMPPTPRPFELLTQEKISFNFPEGAEELHWQSFPSGHTTSAFSMFLLLSWIFRKQNWSFVFVLMAILVGLSRTYLTAHFLRDTYFGMIIGVELTGLILWIYEKRFMN